MPGYDSNIDKTLRAMIDQALAASKALRNVDQAQPNNMGTEENPAPNPFDRKEITKFFSSEESERNYSLAVSSGQKQLNSNVIKMAAKMGSDILGQMEREYKQMSVTPIRAMAMEASRKLRHGSPGGPMQNNIIHGIQYLVAKKES